jgi:hypothetical protein
MTSRIISSKSHNLHHLQLESLSYFIYLMIPVKTILGRHLLANFLRYALKEALYRSRIGFLDLRRTYEAIHITSLLIHQQHQRCLSTLGLIQGKYEPSLSQYSFVPSNRKWLYVSCLVFLDPFPSNLLSDYLILWLSLLFLLQMLIKCLPIHFVHLSRDLLIETS